MNALKPQGQSGAGFLPFCGPSGVNDVAPGVTASAASGRTVRTQQSNLDAAGMRLVRKGCVVEFPSAVTARVLVVRLGKFRTVVGNERDAKWWNCRTVKVVA